MSAEEQKSARRGRAGTATCLLSRYQDELGELLSVICGAVLNVRPLQAPGYSTPLSPIITQQLFQ